MCFLSFFFVCIFFLFDGLCILSLRCGAVLRCRIRPALPLLKPLKPASQWASAVPPPQSAQAPPWGLGPPQIRWKTSSQRHTNLLACYPNPATFGQKNVHGTQPGFFYGKMRIGTTAHSLKIESLWMNHSDTLKGVLGGHYKLAILQSNILRKSRCPHFLFKETVECCPNQLVAWQRASWPCFTIGGFSTLSH